MRYKLPMGLAMLDEGTGEPVVVVTAAMSTTANWDRVATHIKAHAPPVRLVRYTRRLYDVDARAAASTHSMKRELDDLRDVLDVVGVPVTLVGHSSGGVVALELARLDPKRVRKLVVYEAPVPLEAPIGGDAARRMRTLIDSGRDGAALALFMRDVVGSPWWMRVVLRVALRVGNLSRFASAQLADVDAIDATVSSPAQYAALAMPTVLLRGRSSPAHLRERVAKLAKVIRGSRIVELATGHHAEMFRPADLARAIADFATDGGGAA